MILRRFLRASSLLIGLLFVSLTSLFLVSVVKAACEIPSNIDSLPDDQKIQAYEKIRRDCESELSSLANKKASLKNEIALIDSKIQLAQVQINQTLNQISVLEKQIEELSQKIEILDTSLNEVSALFINRVVANYKSGRLSSLEMLFSADGFTDFFKRIRYLRAAQMNDRQTLLTMEEIRYDYDRQKEEKKEKQEELEALKNRLAAEKAELDRQRQGRQHLLAVTQSDEDKYQALLAQALAEYKALQAILAGQGDETEVGEVKAGDVIASVISGSSCNSSGTHLHFTVGQGGTPLNPFNYLKPIDHQNCSGPGACTPADPFNPSGSWEWPLSAPIQFFQGYGNSWAVNNTWVGRIYSFHNGIDVKGSSSEVRAVRDGTLYRGSYSGSGGCALRYVRVEHDGSDLSTYYLHINYVKI